MEIQKQCWSEAISVHLITRLLLDKISMLNTKPEIHKQSAEEISTVEEQIHKQSMDMLLIRNLIARRIMKLLSVKESISTKKEPIPKQLAEGFVLQLSAILLVDKISILYTKPEVIVICVDTCYVMTTKPEGGGLLKAQTKAILLYAEEKIKAHDGNQVGLLAMGSMQGPCLVEPTRDLDEIRFALKGLVCIGESEIPIGMVLSFFSNSQLPKRRLVVFSGGPLNMNFAQVQNYAKALKDYKVAVDVVNFGMQFFQKTKKKLLEAFAEAVDNCGNSRYLYAPSGSKFSLSEHIIRYLLAPWSLPMQEKEKKEDEVQKIEKAVDKLDRKKKHMTKNLSSVLAPKGLSMREAKKKEKQAKNIDKKRICYEKEEKAFWELLYSQGWYPVERESETQME